MAQVYTYISYVSANKYSITCFTNLYIQHVAYTVLNISDSSTDYTLTTYALR